MGRSISNAPEEALIFNIQRFSLHDGPGIRTAVFMKGCPLRCPWCSNPESQDIFPNLLVRNINCKGCAKCVKACPNGSISLSPGKGRVIDWSSCDQCLKCVNVCIYQSLNVCGKSVTLEEVLYEVQRDKHFYKNSDGGVTISGGEALCQSTFVANLLKLCKEEGINTAVDTTGYAGWEAIEEVLPYTDLILFDIKHLNPANHRRATGVDNAIIMTNLNRISRKTRVWLRVPLITGFNDSVEHIKRIAVLAKEIEVEKVSLLPYHDGGKAKCVQLGRPYSWPEIFPPSDDWIQKLKEVVEGVGVKVSIGS